MTSPSPSRASRIVGWIAVLLSTAIASFWAFWGIIENFHEGWYFESIWPNLGLMIVQYLSVMLIFLALEHAYMICYNGQVRSHMKTRAPSYFAFRAVKELPAD
jgi:hypothetical protein